MRLAQHKLLPRNERSRGRVPANYPAMYLQGRRRRRIAAGNVAPPFSVVGLRLWLKANSLALADDSPVDAWADSSGSGNDVTQGTGMKRPTFKTNQLNGLPVVRFDGIDDTLFKLAATGFSCTEGHTVIAVLNPTTAVGFGMGVVTNPIYNEMRQTGGGGTAEWMIPSGSFQVNSAGSLEGLWKVWSGTFTVASQLIELFINGVSQGTQLDDTGPLAVSDIYLGSRTDMYHWLGDIAEVLVYDAALGATDRENVENYLIAKYALA